MDFFWSHVIPLYAVCETKNKQTNRNTHTHKKKLSAVIFIFCRNIIVLMFTALHFFYSICYNKQFIFQLIVEFRYAKLENIHLTCQNLPLDFFPTTACSFGWIVICFTLTVSIIDHQVVIITIHMRYYQ